MTRAVVLAALCVALVLAGCAKKADDSPPADNATATTLPTGTNASATSGANATTVTTMGAKDVCSPTIDFTPGAPAVPPDPNAVQSPTQTKPCPGVPAGYQKITMKVTWALGSAPAFVGSAAPVVKLVDPAKASIATCTGPNPGDPAAPKPCEATGSSVPAAGDYQVVGSGSGTASAKVVVTVS